MPATRTQATSNGKVDSAAIYKALVAQSKSQVRGAKLVKKQNTGAGEYAAIQLKGKHIAYVHRFVSGVRLEIRVDGKREARRLTTEKDVIAGVRAIIAKAQEITKK